VWGRAAVRGDHALRRPRTGATRPARGGGGRRRARPWRVFRDITLPILKPILLILISLSIIWDFGVFTQPYLLIGQSKITPGNYLMSIYLFEEGYFQERLRDAVPRSSVLMLLIVAALSVVYVRRMVRIGDEVA